MSRIANLFSPNTLSGGLGYFDYEVAVGQDILVPWLRRHVRLEGLHVGDFGCHQGGILHALRTEGRIASGRGFDQDAASIARSPFPADADFRLEVFDLTQLEAGQARFDLILIRDVLEHIPDYGTVLAKAKGCLSPDGHIFVSFPPYFSPFGGHQQEAANWTRCVPFLHYLPRPVFFRLVETRDTEYMSAQSSLADMQSVADTRLTLAGAERAFRENGLRIRACRHFLLRPEFKIRYGIPAMGNGPLGHIPGLREILTMGSYYLLSP